jgi:intracellular multiplication protein IcmL
MAAEDVLEVGLKDDFYRDSFARLVLALVSMLVAVLLLLGSSIYLYVQKPRPVTFMVDEGWRVVPPVPVNQSYLTTPELLQWVSDTMIDLFVFDFNRYEAQLDKVKPYFTENGYQVFLSQLSNYANREEVTQSKMFVNGVPGGAPVVLNSGILSGKYSWWVQVPMRITYVSNRGKVERNLTLQLLVVRVPTLNNLSGVLIENIIVPKGNER